MFLAPQGIQVEEIVQKSWKSLAQRLQTRGKQLAGFCPEVGTWNYQPSSLTQSKAQ